MLESVLSWAASLLAACAGAAGLGVIFRLPRRWLIAAALSGACTWAVYLLAIQWGSGRFVAGFLGAATAAILAEVGAHRLRMPATLLVVPALVILVPGADAYFAMLAFLQGDNARGLDMAIVTLLAALSIAAGVVAAVTLLRTHRKRPSELVHSKK